MSGQQTEQEEKKTLEVPTAPARFDLLIAERARNLVMQREFARMRHHVSHFAQQVRGLEKASEDMERLIDERVDFYRRNYRTISNLSNRLGRAMSRNVLTAILVFLVIMAVVAYWWLNPGVGQAISTEFDKYALQISAVVVAVAIVIVLIVMRVRRRRQ